MEIVKEFIIKENGNDFSRIGYYNHNNRFILHCEDGPAMLYTHGAIEWWYDNSWVTREVNSWLKDHNIDYWQTMSDEDKLALSFFMLSLH